MLATDLTPATELISQLTGIPQPTLDSHATVSASGAPLTAYEAETGLLSLLEDLHVDPEGDRRTRSLLADVTTGRLQLTSHDMQTARAAIPAIMNPPRTATPAPLIELIRSIQRDARFITFMDYSSDSPTYPLATIEDTQSPTLAKNNCLPATYAIARYIDQRWYPDPVSDHYRIELVYQSGVHWGNLIKLADGSEWVIDVTARQFSPTALHPLLMPRHLWQAWITEHIWASHADRLRQPVLHRQVRPPQSVFL